MGTAISAAAGAVAKALGEHKTASSEDPQPVHTNGVNSYVPRGAPLDDLESRSVFALAPRPPVVLQQVELTAYTQDS